jgi:hypothetical protein
MDGMERDFELDGIGLGVTTMPPAELADDGPQKGGL